MSVDDDDQQMEECMKKLGRLQKLRDKGLVSVEEFDTRKSQIIDELTGTSSTYSNIRKISTSRKYSRRTGTTYERVTREKSRKIKTITIEVKPHGPPDWKPVRIEKAIKHRYSYAKNEWEKHFIKVKIDTVPFEKGGLRYVFHLQDLSCPNEKWVAKMSKDVYDNKNKEIYFKDVQMQAIAKHFSAKYNSYNPPKHVDFLDAYVLELVQREGSPVCHVERYIEGEYKKYNNNLGWVDDSQRNTPQAFAHFTYHASKMKLLVCDIQGVNDLYTDPQVHTSEAHDRFGKGNLGSKGFDEFKRTHRCNVVCQYLKLRNFNALPIPFSNSTKTPSTHMKAPQVDTVKVDFHSNMKLPLLEESTEGAFPELKEDSKCCCIIL